jgi:hypothetical protein
VLDQLTRGLGQAGDAPLREADADVELLALSVAQRDQTASRRPITLGVGPQDSVSAPIRTGPGRSAPPELTGSSTPPKASSPATTARRDRRRSAPE